MDRPPAAALDLEAYFRTNYNTLYNDWTPEQVERRSAQLLATYNQPVASERPSGPSTMQLFDCSAEELETMRKRPVTLMTLDEEGNLVVKQPDGSSRLVCRK